MSSVSKKKYRVGSIEYRVKTGYTVKCYSKKCMHKCNDLKMEELEIRIRSLFVGIKLVPCILNLETFYYKLKTIFITYHLSLCFLLLEGGEE